MDFPSFGAMQVKYLPFGNNQLIPRLLEELYQANKSSLIVEGGAQLLQSFIEADLWDEARIFSTQQHLGSGIAAPQLQGQVQAQYAILEDRIKVLKPN